MPHSIATLFSGGEGVGVGARAAGLKHLWGIEINDAVARVARNNSFNVKTADILEVRAGDYPVPTVLHASPPCPNFSVAKRGRQESDGDLALAEATARFIRVLRPRFFTLENVYLYRKSKSWAVIRDALNSYGYWFDLAHVNAANFGVPQTRKRMIVRAALHQMVPLLPLPEPWVGWYEAIEDLIPTLPESKFAPWQLRGLECKSTMLVDSAGYLDTDGDRIPVTRSPDKPANTIIANHARRPMRAFIVDGAHSSRPPTVRRDDEPMFTVDAARNTRNPRRAFLVGGQYARPADGGPRPVQTREPDEPTFTVTATNKGDWRAWLEHGRVVQMTPRALARFQTFPDSYILPDKKALACPVIGMAVPPLLFQKLIAQLLEVRL